MTDATMVFQVRIPKRLVKKIDAFAEMETRPSRNNMIERLLEEAIERREGGDGEHEHL